MKKREILASYGHLFILNREENITKARGRKKKTGCFADFANSWRTLREKND